MLLPPTLQRTKTRVLDKDEMMLFMQLSMISDKEKNGKLFEDLHDDAMKTSPIYCILHHRMKMGNKTLHPTLGVWIAAVCYGRPNRAVLWAWTCCNLPVTGQAQDIIVWTADFPMGVPTDEEYDRIWDSQNEDGTNMLDVPAVWAEMQKVTAQSHAPTE